MRVHFAYALFPIMTSLGCSARVEIVQRDAAGGNNAVAEQSTGGAAAVGGMLATGGTATDSRTTAASTSQGTGGNAATGGATHTSGAIIPAIAAGDYHTCAVVNGAVQCWGDNENGQLGNNSTT